MRSTTGGRTFFRGVVIDDLTRLVDSPNVPNKKITESMGYVRLISHPGVYFAASSEGPSELAYRDSQHQNGIPVLLRVTINEGNFPLLKARIYRPVDTGGIEHDFEPIGRFADIRDSITLNLGGLNPDQLNQLHYEMATGDRDKPLNETYGEFRSYTEVKKELEEKLQEGKIEGEGGLI